MRIGARQERRAARAREWEDSMIVHLMEPARE